MQDGDPLPLVPFVSPSYHHLSLSPFSSSSKCTTTAPKQVFRPHPPPPRHHPLFQRQPSRPNLPAQLTPQTKTTSDARMSLCLSVPGWLRFSTAKTNNSCRNLPSVRRNMPISEHICYPLTFVSQLQRRKLLHRPDPTSERETKILILLVTRQPSASVPSSIRRVPEVRTRIRKMRSKLFLVLFSRSSRSAELRPLVRSLTSSCLGQH